tara:strand:- start:1670 stop:1897 length:228 start_codon:yes stop_codon:yes gene_type:complete
MMAGISVMCLGGTFMQTKIYFVIDWGGFNWEREEPPTVAEAIDLGGLRFTGPEDECLLFIESEPMGDLFELVEAD